MTALAKLGKKTPKDELVNKYAVILARWEFFIGSDRDGLANAQLDNELSDEFNRVMNMIPEEAVHGEFGEIVKKIPLAASFLTARRIVVGLILLAQLYGEKKVSDNEFARNQLQAWNWLRKLDSITAARKNRAALMFNEISKITSCHKKQGVEHDTTILRLLVDLLLDASFKFNNETFEALVGKSQEFFSSIIQCTSGSGSGKLNEEEVLTKARGGHETNLIQDELINRHKELIIAVLLASPHNHNSIEDVKKALNPDGADHSENPPSFM